jgi:hypothetical protein
MNCVLQEGLSKEKRSRLEVLGHGQIMIKKKKLYNLKVLGCGQIWV